MQLKEIVNDASKFITNLFEEKISSELTFHNLNHSFEVLQAVQIIGAQINISETKLCAVEVAALFHDCGYSEAYVGHEEISRKIAASFLTEQDCTKEFIAEVDEYIASTRSPQNPANELAKILCDADMYHFTKPNYPQYAAALRKEHAVYFNKIYSDSEWIFKNYEFLSYHNYFTDYGKNVLEQFKQLNIMRLKSKMVA